MLLLLDRANVRSSKKIQQKPTRRNDRKYVDLQNLFYRKKNVLYFGEEEEWGDNVSNIASCMTSQWLRHAWRHRVTLCRYIRTISTKYAPTVYLVNRSRDTRHKWSEETSLCKQQYNKNFHQMDFIHTVELYESLHKLHISWKNGNTFWTYWLFKLQEGKHGRKSPLNALIKLFLKKSQWRKITQTFTS